LWGWPCLKKSRSGGKINRILTLLRYHKNK
jgi:hypothetical protein